MVIGFYKVLSVHVSYKYYRTIDINYEFRRIVLDTANNKIPFYVIRYRL